ncbi:hypothetical protein EV182_006451, partial [Spiromyces aspiralis]
MASQATARGSLRARSPRATASDAGPTIVATKSVRLPREVRDLVQEFSDYALSSSESEGHGIGSDNDADEDHVDNPPTTESSGSDDNLAASSVSDEELLSV